MATPLFVATPTKIINYLPLGDSITVGFMDGGSYYVGGYRKFLHALAFAEGVKLKTLGNQNANSTGMGQLKHEGVGGEHIAQIKTRMLLVPSTPAPDVVTLHAGTNNFFYYARDGAGVFPITNVQTLHTDLLDSIFARWPSTQIICLTLGHWYTNGGSTGPIFVTMEGLAEKTSFNTYLNALPGSHAKGSQIKIAPMDTKFNTTSVLNDGLHPNGVGYQLMAWEWWKIMRTII